MKFHSGIWIWCSVRVAFFFSFERELIVRPIYEPVVGWLGASERTIPFLHPRDRLLFHRDENGVMPGAILWFTVDQHPERDSTHVLWTVCAQASLFLFLLFFLLLLLLFFLLFLPVGISGNASVICATGYRFHLHIPIGSFVHCYLRCHVIPWSNSLTRSNPGSPLHSISRNVVLGHRSRYLDNRFFFFF